MTFGKRDITLGCVPMASAQNDLTLEAALASFDKTSIQSHLSEGAKERKQITDRFPLDS